MKDVYKVLVVMAIVLIHFSCKREKFEKSSGAKIDFSTDTVFFDTIFTTMQSGTEFFKVYNPNKDKIRFNSIRLANGNSSFYRLNIDGVATREVKDFVLEGEDSIFIFVEVLLDPNNENNPMVIQDSVVFEWNDNRSDVDLVAWGQDAYIHKPKEGESGFYLDELEIWASDKPHIVYGVAAVPPGGTFVVQKGARIHMHNNAMLFVDKGASIKMNGTREEPIKVSGTRLEEHYSEVPGQWLAIFMTAGSEQNSIKHTEIKNGRYGLIVDSMDVTTSTPTLVIENSVVKNMRHKGLWLRGARVRARNLGVANCGENLVDLFVGGDYDFRHCTFNNNWAGDIRQTSSLSINNWFIDAAKVVHVRPIINAYFGNCVLTGNNEGELYLDSIEHAEYQSFFNVQFENTALKIASKYEDDKQNPDRYQDVLFNEFISIDDSLRLSEGSPAIDAGALEVLNGESVLQEDLYGNLRDAKPDMGALEYQPE